MWLLLVCLKSALNFFLSTGVTGYMWLDELTLNTYTYYKEHRCYVQKRGPLIKVS